MTLNLDNMNYWKLLPFTLLFLINISSFSQCIITTVTATSGACSIPQNTYTVSGNIVFTNAPISGTLTIKDCHGGMQVFNPPFTSPQSWSIASIPADGAPCHATAVFSFDTLCTLTTNYTAPANCSPTSILEIENKQLKIYPNPSKGILIINIDIKLNSKTELVIFSVTGKVVEKFTLQTNSQITLDTKNLSSGVYFYVLYSDDAVSEKGKLIIEN